MGDIVGEKRDLLREGFCGLLEGLLVVVVEELDLKVVAWEGANNGDLGAKGLDGRDKE